MARPEPHGERTHGRRADLLLALLALVLYLPGVSWGLPDATAEGRHFTYATDELLPLGPLAEMHNTFVVSKPDRNYGYPWWHYFVCAAAQAPYLAWLEASGGLAAPSPEYPFGLVDPVAGLRGLTIAGRLLSVLMAVGVVLAARRFAAELFGEAAGSLAALLTLSEFLLVFYAATGNVDVPALLWTSLGLVVFARILARGFTVRRAAWLGLWAGVAMATKDQALAVFLPLGAALALPAFLRGLPGAGERYPRRAVLAGLAASVAAYLVCTGMLVDPARHVEHVRRLLFAPEALTAADVYRPPTPGTLSGRIGLLGTWIARLATEVSPPVLLAALVGLALAARRAPRRLVLALPAVALFLLLALPMGHAVRRYFLLLVLPLDAFAAVALLAIGGSSVTGRALRGGAIGLVLLLRLAPIVDLRAAQWHETRAAAADWIESHTPPGARFEYFGHAQAMPHLDATRPSRRIAGREEWQGETGHGPRVLAYLGSGSGPEYVVVVPDWTSKPGMARSADCPPEVYQALLDGSAGYALAAVFERRSPLSWLPGTLRPRLDSEMVAPPVRVFVRRDRAAGTER